MKNKTIKGIKNKTQVEIEELSLYQLCRWSALKDAIDLVADKCEERNIDFNTCDLKPLDLQKYVDSATDELYNKATTLKK